MCDTTGNHSHKHGVRTSQEKAYGDIRNNIAIQMDLLTKIEGQLAVIGAEDFPMVGAIVHTLEHLKGDLKKGVAEQFQLLNALDAQQAAFFNEDDHGHGHGHDDDDHGHDHGHEHGHEHGHAHA
ncbi:MAG: hypothetical protein HZA24_05425 [Nitrospirae bacterium]|nr:hypothetical protein [Nitrospirota bacterium]